MGRVTFPLHSYPGTHEGDTAFDRAAALSKAVQVGIEDGKLILNLITTRLRSDGLTATAIALVPRPMHDDVLIIVEGDGLPPFVRGSQPWAVASYGDLVNTWGDSLTPYKKAGG